MRKLFLISVSLICFLVTPAIIAAEYKIGVLDVNAILSNTPQVEVMQTKLKNQFEPKMKELAALNKGLQADIEKFAKSNAAMKPAQRKSMQTNIAKQQGKIRQFKASFQRNLEAAQNQAQQTILKQIQDAVSKIAKKEQYDLIVIKDTVAFNAPAYDISNQVSDLMKNVK